MADNQQSKQETQDDINIELEIQDDTPPEDRGKQPMPQDMVKELEEDELEEYSEKVKTRLLQMKKVWHDERRDKERAYREQQEAVTLAQNLLSENKKLKSRLNDGEKSLVLTATSAAELEMEMARGAYKEAIDTGDSEQMVKAQEKLNSAGIRLDRLKGYKPSLQEEETQVNLPPTQVPVVRLDQKTDAWNKRNQWFGQDEEMTATALGLDQKLRREFGEEYVKSDEYWEKVDKTMRRRFPEYFGDETIEVDSKPAQRTEKLATVVAPASRSTASKKVVLKQSQLDLAKRLGLTPEQYAREFAKTMGA